MEINPNAPIIARLEIHNQRANSEFVVLQRGSERSVRHLKLHLININIFGLYVPKTAP
jgi:hypothetical protein